MSESGNTQIEKLYHSLRVLEAQQAILGEAIAPAIEAVRQQIAVLETQVSSSSPPAEDRRIVAILFTDIVGSTALAEKLDPEEWREVVAAVHAMAGRAIQKRQGMVLQYLGDGLLAVFGAQVLSERDPENAIRAALDIQANLGALQVGVPIQMRVSVHTGLVVVGELGSEARREFTATGDAMNLAARLQSAAPPGGVLISHETYRYVRGLFDVVLQPPLAVKGKSEPLQTYVVLRFRPFGLRTASRGVAGIETHTVGRQAETEQIRTAFREVMESRGFGWLQLLGEPGIGKSRLLNDFLATLASRAEGIALLRARTLPGDERQAFALIRNFWFDRFQIAEDTPLAEAETRWVNGILALSGVWSDLSQGSQSAREEAAHALGLLVGLPFSESPYLFGLRHDPSQAKGRAYVVSRALLGAIRERMPVVLLLEDLHWADTASWEYLQEVIVGPAESLPVNQGLFILATARPEWDPPKGLREHGRYVQIDLTPLSGVACRELVEELTHRVAGMPETVVQMIVERAEGNPYFVEELVNWFLDRGAIDRSSEPWRFLPEKLLDSPLPPTLQHLLLTRLNALGTKERVALQRGAIFGRDFWEGGLQAMGVPSSGDILAPLQPRGFVHTQLEPSFAGEMEWSFYHNLQRDVAYESVLKRERKSLHKTAAAWLETQARQANRLDEFAGLIGGHAERAGEADDAADWYLRAGQSAMKRGAFLEARQFLERSRDFTPEVDWARRWEILLAHAEVVSVLGDIATRLADNAALLALAEKTGDDNLLAEANFYHGYSLRDKGDDHAALQAFQAGLAAARRVGNLRLEALLLGVLLVSQTHLGEIGQAITTARLALEKAQDLGDEDVLARALNNVSLSYLAIGDLVKAVQVLDQQVEINHRIGNRVGEAIGLVNLGYTYLGLGRFSAGRSALEQSLRLSDAIGYRRLSAYTRLNLGLVYWREGESGAARQVLEQTIPVFAELGDAFGQADGQAYLGLALEQAGEMVAAERNFSTASRVFEQLGSRGFAADALAGRARTALALGQLEQVRQDGEQLWQSLSESGGEGMELPGLAYQTCVQVFQALGDVERAGAAFEAGRRKLIERAEKIGDLEWRKSFLDNVPEHRFLMAAWDVETGSGG